MIKLSGGNFITVPRSVFDENSFPIEPYSRREAFLDLVQRATHEPMEIPVKGGFVSLDRGELAVSFRNLAARWMWSKSKVERVIKEFISWSLVGQRTDGLTTILSISNYDVFQHPWDKDEDKNEDANEDNNKNKTIKEEEKKLSNDSKEKTKRFIKPTLEQIAAYCKETNRDIDVERFYYFYESKGWYVGKNPMKNWRAAVATWAKGKETQQSLFPQEPTESLPQKSKEELMEEAKNPTRDEKNKWFKEYIRPFHPQNQGESAEEYFERVKPICEKQMKVWIDERILNVERKFYGVQ